MRQVFFAVALLALSFSVAEAQPSPSATRHAIHLIKLPNGDYTVPMSELEGSGTNGKVLFHPQGMKTLVTVTVFGKRNYKHSFNLHSGKDCAPFGGPASYGLTPAMTGMPSRTLVSLPITNLTAKDYVVDAQDATARQQAREACARL